MLTNIALLGLLTVPMPRVPAHDAFVVRPRIEVWSSHGDGVYTRGQGVRVYFRADQDAFVTLFRVDTDGRVRVLFPRDPWEDNFVRGGHEFEVQGSGSRNAFYVDDYAGVGYLFAVAAADPFEYGAIESGNHWDYRTIADGRVRGDPYVALTELAERIVPEGYADWDYDIVPYYVERQYDYPRFLCYDCHAYVSYPYWDPYWRSCVRFRVVMYDDPYYYPYRYYGGRVVFVRPFRPQPRFVFKDRDGSGRDRFVTKEPNRPVNDDTRRSPTRVTGTTGIIPAPRDMPRRDRPTAGATGTAPDRNRPEQPNRPDDDRGRRGGRNEDRGRNDDRDRGRSDDRDKAQRVPANVPRWEPTPRYTPPRETPRAEPRSTPRAEPRNTPRAEPRNTPRAESPRAERPRSEPRASEPKDKAQQPELRRRKPD